jgi:hypothetical protein
MEISSRDSEMIPDHKVILEEALIALRQKIGLSFWKHWKTVVNRRNPYLMANSILFWLTKQQKERKEL